MVHDLDADRNFHSGVAFRNSFGTCFGLSSCLREFAETGGVKETPSHVWVQSVVLC